MKIDPVAPVTSLALPSETWTSEPGRDNPPLAGEFVITEAMHAGDTAAGLGRRLAARLLARRGTILSLMVYGSCRHVREIEAGLQDELGPVNWPVTFVEGGGCGGRVLAGVQAYAISGQPVTRIRIGSRVVGSVYVDADARHCLLGGLEPGAVDRRPAAQLQELFGTLQSALELAGFTVADVVRTWFYNADILAWYGEFNRVRSAFYGGINWRTGSLPASTGIGAVNPAGAAVVAAVWAVQPLSAMQPSPAREIASPLQCPAPAYGSSFSRAMEIESGGLRRLLVSGTASIEPGGRTVWVGDITGQIDRTMEVVAAILHSRGMGFGDVSRATCYYQRPDDRAGFEFWRTAHHQMAMPVVDTHSVVCRGDLLFEIELDAVMATRTR